MRIHAKSLAMMKLDRYLAASLAADTATSAFKAFACWPNGAGDVLVLSGYVFIAVDLSLALPTERNHCRS